MHWSVSTLRFLVERRARTLMQIGVGAKGAKEFSRTVLELCVPRLVDGYVVMWVGAEAPFGHVECIPPA